ncbi:MAG: M16 family metallopeptidase [Pseudomonadota bacterium]
MIRVLLSAIVALLLAAPLRAEIAIQEVTSPGGIKAWLVEEHSIPFTALEIRFKGGTALDAPGKRGAVKLMAATLEEGAGDLDSQGFAAARDDLAAGIRFDAGDDAVSVSAKFLTENRDRAVDLLRMALIEPRFDPAALDRVRGQMISIVESNAKDPQEIAAATFRRLAYGDHPYATSDDGTRASLQGLTRDDILAAKAATMARDRLFVSAVGDITPEDLGRLLDRLLGDLPATGAPMPPPARVDLAGGVTVVDFASPQSMVVFGQPGLRFDDPDFFAAYVLNHILGGGGFESRLMNEVREKRGLTYGIASYLVNRDLADTWQGSFASANEKVAEAVQVTRDEWARMAAGGVTDAELAEAKTYLTGSYPLRFDGNGPIADILVGMQLDGRPMDYVQKRNGYIEAVTKADIARVARRLMTPEGLRFVVVGQPAGLSATN